MGPFNEYAPPGVYTDTVYDNSIPSLIGNVRIPAIVGTADEVKLANQIDMARGSSATRDQKKVNEPVTTFNGTNKAFVAKNFPLVKGDGTGRVTNNVADVIVMVNDVQAVVMKVDGLTGTVTLALAPKVVDIVTVTYYYKLTDTKVIDENLSAQIDGVTKSFYTDFTPIVDGSNAGKTTTNVNNVIVKVNNVITQVIHLDGANGNFILAIAPALGNTLNVTYYFNKYMNTADDLPYTGLTSVIRVGLSPETSDYIENIDYAIIDNQIQWGTGYKLVIASHTTGSEFFDENQITANLIDDVMYDEFLGDGVQKSFTTRFMPIVDGTGKDTVTNDPTKVLVTVNGIAITVARVDGANGMVYLQTAPALGDVVNIKYWRSRMGDDSYTFKVTAVGAAGVGTYKVNSLNSGVIGDIEIKPGSVAISAPNLSFLSQPAVAKSFTVDEEVTILWTSTTDFTVTSTNPNGSAGTGKTGVTYVDAVTKLFFTIESDPGYMVADTFKFTVTKDATFTTDLVREIFSIPGLKFKVTDTTNTTVDDETILMTFDKSGNEPNVGDTYYMTYYYIKTDFDCKIFTKFKDIVNEYGTLGPNNPISLSSYLMFLNGATVLICCQVKKSANSETAADQDYNAVVDRLKFPVNGQNPSIIFPVTTSPSVITATVQHCNIMSSKRMRKERTTMFGFAVGTEPLDAANFAAAIRSERAIALYPDGAQLQLVASDGSIGTFTVDGSYLAAALIGVNVSTAYDVAEPMTRKQLVGFSSLVREMDEATMDMVATKGVTIIERIDPVYRVRHCLTTRMDSIFYREYNVTTIRDYVQQQARLTLDEYIGRKMVRTLPDDVAASLGAMLRAAKDGTIIFDYKGATAEIDPTQPDYIKASAFYIPIFGCNYIETQFLVRVRF